MVRRKKRYGAASESEQSARGASARAAAAARNMITRADRAISMGDCVTASKQMHGAYAALGTYQQKRLLSARIGNIGVLQQRVTRIEAKFIRKCVIK